MEKEKKICLSKLYKSIHIRNAVWNCLTEHFNKNFERLINQPGRSHTSIVQNAKEYKTSIKELVIEYGYELQTIPDLVKCLDQLHIWDEADDIKAATTKSELYNPASQLEKFDRCD